MFPKKSRYSFKEGLPRKVISFPSFSLRFEKNDIGARIAVVVSKKVDKSAVARNSIKRKFLDLLKENGAQDLSYSLVFYLRRNALENDMLSGEIKEALNKLNNVPNL
ncbi:MAG TPA: ribonuclease P protein component [Patescibacteria group bacterium]|nr:ribonuclease P protein component [Patescibacteria group bacterium]